MTVEGDGRRVEDDALVVVGVRLVRAAARQQFKSGRRGVAEDVEREAALLRHDQRVDPEVAVGRERGVEDDGFELVQHRERRVALERAQRRGSSPRARRHEERCARRDGDDDVVCDGDDEHWHCVGDAAERDRDDDFIVYYDSLAALGYAYAIYEAHAVDDAADVRLAEDVDGHRAAREAGHGPPQIRR